MGIQDTCGYIGKQTRPVPFTTFELVRLVLMLRTSFDWFDGMVVWILLRDNARIP